MVYLFIYFKNLFIYLFIAALGLHCFRGFSLVAESRGYSIVAVCGLLTEVASLVAELWLQQLPFLGSRAQAQ